MTLDVFCPWPPSKNSVWRVYNGRIILSAEARKYHARAAKILPGLGSFPEGQLLRASIDFCPPSRALWDLDGRIPVLLDAFVRCGVIGDDSQVWRLDARKHAFTSKKDAGANVVIEVL